jgi:hypothetical protein
VRRLTTARLALLAAVWGSSFLWIKPTLRGPSPVEVTLARLLLGAAVLFVIVAVRRHRPGGLVRVPAAAGFGLPDRRPGRGRRAGPAT